jgi:hypothetical protein
VRILEQGAGDFDFGDDAIESHRALFVHRHGAAGEQFRHAIAKVDVLIDLKEIEWRSAQHLVGRRGAEDADRGRVHEHDSGVSRNEDAVGRQLHHSPILFVAVGHPCSCVFWTRVSLQRSMRLAIASYIAPGPIWSVGAMCALHRVYASWFSTMSGASVARAGRAPPMCHQLPPMGHQPQSLRTSLRGTTPAGRRSAPRSFSTQRPQGPQRDASTAQ